MGRLFKAIPDCWQSLLLESMGVDERIRALVRLRSDTSFKNEEERVEAFVSSGLGSRATYYRWKAEMEKSSGEPLAISA